MAFTVGLGSTLSVTEYVIVSDTGMKYVAPFGSAGDGDCGRVFALYCKLRLKFRAGCRINPAIFNIKGPGVDLVILNLNFPVCTPLKLPHSASNLIWKACELPAAIVAFWGETSLIVIKPPGFCTTDAATLTPSSFSEPIFVTVRVKMLSFEGAMTSAAYAGDKLIGVK